MILLIDWGNTYLKYLLVESTINFESQLALTNIKQAGSINDLHSFISRNNSNSEHITKAYISSVRKLENNQSLSKLLSDSQIETNFASSQAQFGNINCAYKDVNKLGVDRWLTIVASYSKEVTTGVIDIGSAITLDVIDKNGQHLGGHIVPGYRLLLDSLKTTGRIEISDQLNEKSSKLLGKSTSQCVKLGVDKMIKGYLETAIREISNQHQIKKWIFTGGGGEYWHNHLSVSKTNHCTYDGLLVFRGLTKYLNQ